MGQTCAKCIARIITAVLAACLVVACQAATGTQTPSESMAGEHDPTHQMEGNPEHTMEVPDSTVPYALATFSTGIFAGSGECGFCHTGLTDETQQDVSIETHWRSTMMANAARDPFWLAKVSVEVERLPSLKDTIEDTCATCHMPMARTQASIDKTPSGIQANGFVSSGHALHILAMDGVSCTVCHQIQKDNLGEDASFSGGYIIDAVTALPNRLIFGPFPDPFERPMINHTGFIPRQSDHIAQAKLCATCHTLFTPYVDETGKVAGSFPEQTPYLEWLHSDYSQNDDSAAACQTCHMPLASGSVIVSNRPAGGQLSPRPALNQHYFVGGNTIMLTLLQANVNELGLTASPEHLQATIARTQNQLQQNTASVSIQNARVEQTTLTFEAKIEVYTGHKFPTGFPARRAWLHVTVVDTDGEVVFESGAPRENGSIDGCDADQDAATYEPHFDSISSADQVQIYESIMRDTQNQVTYTLMRSAGYAKDNRLLPTGFDPATADEAISAVGLASDQTFGGGGDTVTYVVDLDDAKGAVTVIVELLYQSLSYRTVADLNTADTEAAAAFSQMISKTSVTPVVVSHAETTIEL